MRLPHLLPAVLSCALVLAGCGTGGSAGIGGSPDRAPAAADGSSAGATLTSALYGYRIPVPAGWKDATLDGKPPGESAAVLLTPTAGTAAHDGLAIQVRVCKGGAPCPGDGGIRTVQTTKQPATLAGVDAMRFEWTRETVAGTKRWMETHLTATRHGFTYDLELSLPMGETAVPPAYDAVRAGWAWLEPTAAQAPTVPFTTIHMIDATTGWALGGRLFRTADGGATWTAVTPPGMTAGVAAKFADAGHAWVAWSSEGQPSVVTVARTADGGQTWSAAEVTRNAQGARLYAQSLTFAGPERGWLMVVPEHGMNSSPGELFATADGGRSWQPVASTERGNLPLGGSVRLVSASQGWLAGSPVSTAPQRLYQTDDGGRSWRRVTLPLPPGVAQVSAGLPQFFPAAGSALLPAEFEQEGGSIVGDGFYLSHDGGRTWIDPRVMPGADAPRFLDPLHGYAWTADHLELTSDGGATWRAVDDGTLTAVLANRTPLAANFVSARQGFALVGNADGALLLTTADGGQSWTERPALVRP